MSISLKCMYSIKLFERQNYRETKHFDKHLALDFRFDIQEDEKAKGFANSFTNEKRKGKSHLNYDKYD